MSSAFFLLALSSTASADTLLQAKFKKGETQKQKMTQTQNMTMIFARQPPVKTEQLHTMNMEVICDDVTDTGIATLRHRLPRMQMTMQVPPPLSKKLEYDSDGPAPTDPILQQIDKMVRPMVGVDFSMKCNRQGHISDLAIPPKALDGLKASPAVALGGNFFSESGMKQMGEQGGIGLPEKPVKSGDK